MSLLTLDSRLVRLPGLVASEMDGDLVMMSIQHGKYFGISGVGTRVWELIEQPVSVGQIVAVICQEFDISESTCRNDMLAFSAELLAHKVAEVC